MTKIESKSEKIGGKICKFIGVIQTKYKVKYSRIKCLNTQWMKSKRKIRGERERERVRGVWWWWWDPLLLLCGLAWPVATQYIINPCLHLHVSNYRNCSFLPLHYRFVNVFPLPFSIRIQINFYLIRFVSPFLFFAMCSFFLLI